ncbi:thiamine pyrophosphate-binding protein [Novosphingobium sp. 9]|uniref:thiamine pyrophosphate-binding protein n=1 Tax=Novosphingobium sp. 9 TaxID=2025349 RepID=UPI0021B530C1|nr:thiamine pyrophosphate-binding protein [Novosphingobium sp. 9]
MPQGSLSDSPLSDTSSSESQSSAMLVLRQLQAEGIDYFFANGGTDFPPIAEAYALARNEGIDVPRPMVIPHENLAVAMAHGVYMTTGRMQAVMLHVNVGSANAINALLDASRDETPVLLMAGRSPYSERGRNGTRTRYIHWAQEMFDQAGMLREAVKWDYELHLPEQGADAVARAAQVALSVPRGPVYLTLPRDVIAEDARGHQPVAPLAPNPAPRPDPQSLATLARWLGEAKRPLIVTAAAGRTPKASPRSTVSRAGRKCPSPPSTRASSTARRTIRGSQASIQRRSSPSATS